MKDQRSRAPASVDNIYKLDGRVPVGKAIPFGLQHVLAMFVANVTPDRKSTRLNSSHRL